MSARPTTLTEWQEYIDGLDGAPLRNKAQAANSIALVRRHRRADENSRVPDQRHGPLSCALVEVLGPISP